MTNTLTIRLILLTALSFSFIGRPAVGEEPTTTPTTIDPQGEKVVRDLAEFYKSLQHGGVKASVALSASRFGEEMNLNVVYDFAFKRPNLFSLRAESAMYGGNAVCDGEHLYVHVPMAQRYVESDAPASLDELTDGNIELSVISVTGGSEFQILLGLLSSDPHEQFMDNVAKLKYLGEVTIDEKILHHLRVTDKDEPIDVDFWIHAGDQPWLFKVKPDMEAFFKQLAEQYGQEFEGGAPEITLQFNDWTTEPPADDAFVFTAPEGAEKVDSFFEDMGMDDSKALELIGKEAPAFELDLLDGGKFRLADHRGEHIVILDFWATWCRPCINAIPILIEVSEAYRDRGVVFYSINLAEGNDLVQKFIDKHNFTLNVAMDREGKIAGLYSAMAIPQTVIIDSNGIVQTVHIGLLPNLKEELTKELDTLLRGENLFEEEPDDSEALKGSDAALEPDDDD